MKDPLSDSGMCMMGFHNWEYLHDRNHRICKNCGLCQINGANGWLKCTLAFLHDHIKRIESEIKERKKRKEVEEVDRENALIYLRYLQHKKCPKCQTTNIDYALYCRRCGEALIPQVKNSK